MEKLVNCDLILSIREIEGFNGGNQKLSLRVRTDNNQLIVIKFDCIWDMRYSIENGYIDRYSNFLRDIEKESSVLVVENSKYIKYFDEQVSGTRPTDKLVNYIINDSTDTVIEILSLEKPYVETGE